MHDKTPYEAWYGRRPNVHYFRTFGCVAHVKLVKPNLKKLDDRSVPMVFFGYEPGSKALERLFSSLSLNLVNSCPIIVDEFLLG